MRSNLKKLKRLAFCVWMLFYAPLSQAQGITNVDSYTIFRTGTNEPLLSLSLTNSFPDVGTIPTLSFEFGFATEEPDILDTFFDSFFLTLQSSNQSATVFSADRTGVAWSPPTPGGVELNTNTMLIHANAFPTNAFSDLSPIPPLRFSYNVALFLPAPLATGPLGIFFDFFDNLNQFASMAYVIGLRLDATGSVGTQARFYRLNSTIRTRIDSIQEDSSSLVLAYHFEPSILELYSAPTTNGPFVIVTNATLRAADQVFVFDHLDTNRVFRILSETNVTIVSIGMSNASSLVEFDFESAVAPVKVESALSIAVPSNAVERFFERPATRPELARRKLRVAKPGFALPSP